MLEVTSRGTIDPTTIVGGFDDAINSLNIAAASGKQFAVFTEHVPNGEDRYVGLNTQLIARIRPVEADDAFLSG